jgi:hypothetical protein
MQVPPLLQSRDTFSWVKGFLDTVKSNDKGPMALLSLQRKAYFGFLSSLAGFEPANLRFNGKHAKYKTTKDDS